MSPNEPVSAVAALPPTASALPAHSPPPSASPSEARVGLLYGLAAYGSWGLLPLYFKWLEHVPPLELLAHRVVWAILMLAAWLHLARRWGDVAAVLRDPRARLMMLGTTLLIGLNWGVFIYAVISHQLLQASFGYFVTPLINLALGVMLLRERLRTRQWLCVALAAAGVATLAWRAGEVPVVALILAFSFGFYGLLRKTAPVDALTGMFVEVLLLAPLGIAYFIWQGAAGGLAFLHGPPIEDFGMFAAGAITALPLMWFAQAARRLPMTTIGFLQYIAPSGQLVLAILAFGEKFTPAHAVGFGLIWTALVLYSLDAAARLRR